MFKILKIGLSFLFFLVFAFPVQAVAPGNIIINEIAWMGTEESWQNEWIELYNNTDEAINLDEWTLKADDGTPTINLARIIPANGFYILERTDDDTLPDIPADQIYTGALDNNGENLALYDNLGNLIDSVDCSDGWFAGDNKTKQTMERRVRLKSDPENWQTSQNPEGTPKAKNSLVEESTQVGPVSAQSKEDLAESGSPPTYSSGIIINEILPSPEGPDAEEEWVEIFNKNSFGVDISGWRINDAVGRTKTYIFPEGTKIPGQGFLILPRPTTKITLNNDGDSLKLIQPNGNIIDTVTYRKAPLGQSYNRTESGWIWKDNLTPGFANIIQTPISESRKESSQGATKEKELAGISEQIPEEISPLPLLIASGIAIFSGIIILILKRNLINHRKKSDIT